MVLRIPIGASSRSEADCAGWSLVPVSVRDHRHAEFTYISSNVEVFRYLVCDDEFF